MAFRTRKGSPTQTSEFTPVSPAVTFEKREGPETLIRIPSPAECAHERAREQGNLARALVDIPLHVPGPNGPGFSTEKSVDVIEQDSRRFAIRYADDYCVYREQTGLTTIATVSPPLPSAPPNCVRVSQGVGKPPIWVEMTHVGSEVPIVVSVDWEE